MTTEGDARAQRALEYLAHLGLSEGPWEGDFPTFTAWQNAWATYVHDRAMAMHRFHRAEREAQASAQRAVREAKAPKPRRAASPSAEARSPLSADDVAEMRRRRAAGETRSSVAAAFGIAPESVTRICGGRRWRQTLTTTTP